MKEESKLCDVELKGTLESFNKEEPKVLDGVITCLEKRYEDISEGLIASMSVANIKTWPPNFVDGMYTLIQSNFMLLTQAIIKQSGKTQNT